MAKPKNKSKVTATWLQYKNGDLVRMKRKETGKTVSEIVLGQEREVYLNKPEKFGVVGFNNADRDKMRADQEKEKQKKRE